MSNTSNESRHDTCVEILYIVDSLRNALKKAGGSDAMLRPEHLQAISAMDLLVTLAPNHILFIHAGNGPT